MIILMNFAYPLFLLFHAYRTSSSLFETGRGYIAQPSTYDDHPNTVPQRDLANGSHFVIRNVGLLAFTHRHDGAIDCLALTAATEPYGTVVIASIEIHLKTRHFFALFGHAATLAVAGQR